MGIWASIDLEDQRGQTPEGGDRIVLSAHHSTASLLLFIDDDQLSYLELAPHDDEAWDQFPPVAELSV